MTVTEAINFVKTTNETNLPDSMLAGWLAELDGKIIKEDFLRREINISYDAASDKDTLLILKAPYDAAYPMWLLYKIHLFRGEYSDADNLYTEYENVHGAWRQGMLQDMFRDKFGRPILLDLAFIRRGSDGTIHLKPAIKPEDITGFEVYILQNSETILSYSAETEDMEATKGWIAIRIPAEDSKKLSTGTAEVVTKITNELGETYESDAVQLRILKSLLEA